MATPVGCTVLTRMECGASQFANDRMSPTRPCLLAVYAVSPAVPLPPVPDSPWVELISTIAPPWPASTIDGAAALTVFQAPVRFTSRTSAKVSSSSAAAHERRDPGVGDDDPDRAEGRHGLVDGRLQGAAVADVDGPASTRRPCASTSRAVSARSSGVARG